MSFLMVPMFLVIFGFAGRGGPDEDQPILIFDNSRDNSACRLVSVFR